MMKRIMTTLTMCFATLAIFAQAFEGVMTVTYKNDKSESTVAEVKVKGNEVHIKQTQNGNKKYAYFVLNLETQDFYTVSTAEKKIVIKYKLDKLLEFYETHNIKEGYKQNYGLALKATDKTKVENGVTLTKAIAENDAAKVSAWLGESNTTLNKLIPLLRLIGNWNEAQGTDKLIVSAEATNKVSKKESSVSVVAKKEAVAKEIFNLPKNYTVKDFARIMDDEKGSKDIEVVIRTFTEF